MDQGLYNTYSEDMGLIQRYCSLQLVKFVLSIFKELACQISVDSEQLEKSQQNGYIRLPSMEPFNYEQVDLAYWPHTNHVSDFTDHIPTMQTTIFGNV